MNTLTLLDAINAALAWELAHDDNVVLFGEDIGKNGGVFRATLGLQERFGEQRVLDAPLAETQIAGMAIGMAAQGLRPVCEIQFAGFMYSTFDHLINHAAHRGAQHHRAAQPATGAVTQAGGGIHAPEHHGESPEAWLAHTPGLKVVSPSSPARAYGLLLAAIRDPDPVIFLEPTRLYRLLKEPVADNGEALPLGAAFTLREGCDVTLVSWGASVLETLQAAEQLAEQGVSAEVIDVASLKPLDMPTILASVAKTGRCVIVHEAARQCGVGAEIAANLASEGLMSLLAPVERVTGFDTPLPLARLEDEYLPSVARILAAVERVRAY